MKSLIKVALLIVSIFFLGCEPEKSAESFQIIGKINGHSNATIYLDRYNPYGNELLDSAKTDGNGNFELSHPNPNNQLFLLRMPNNQSVFIFPEQNTLQIDAEIGQFSGAEVSGSAWTKELFKFSNRRSQLRGDFVNASKKLQNIDKITNVDRWMEQEALADAAMEAYRDYVRAFVDTVSQNELALFGAANLNPEGNFYYLQQFLKERRESSSNSEIFKYLDSKIQEGGRNFLAYQAINFGGMNQLGDSIFLDQFKGKPVYLYVWASYCGLSRAENERLVEMRKHHPENAIEILTFSIDDNELSWTSAIARDSMNWPTQLRGKYGWQSPEIRQFGIETIPTSFVLDAKGIIRAKNMHAKELDAEYESVVERWGGNTGK